MGARLREFPGRRFNVLEHPVLDLEVWGILWTRHLLLAKVGQVWNFHPGVPVSLHPVFLEHGSGLAKGRPDGAQFLLSGDLIPTSILANSRSKKSRTVRPVSRDRETVLGSISRPTTFLTSDMFCSTVRGIVRAPIQYVCISGKPGGVWWPGWLATTRFSTEVFRRSVPWPPFSRPATSGS